MSRILSLSPCIRHSPVLFFRLLKPRVSADAEKQDQSSESTRRAEFRLSSVRGLDLSGGNRAGRF